MNKNGRPRRTEFEFTNWLEQMSPFLRNGNSLYSAIEKAGLHKHKDSIYRKWRLNDWFCEKIQHFQNELGELANEVSVRMIKNIHEKVIKDILTVSGKEMRYIRWFATHHRSCEPFFVQRYERVKKVDEAKEARELAQLKAVLEGK